MCLKQAEITYILDLKTVYFLNILKTMFWVKISGTGKRLFSAVYTTLIFPCTAKMTLFLL